MSKYFKGYYFKHQKGGHTVSFIVGRSECDSFIQVISNNTSYKFSYPVSDYTDGDIIKAGGCEFSKYGAKINIHKDNNTIRGEIRYSDLTPLNYDIMGPFKYLPMQCRHSVISMYHTLSGRIDINGEVIDFTDGVGYIEGDRGVSFPKAYTWVQCNYFNEKCSVMASVADIPFMGSHFKGCICVVYFKGREYRLATYLGVKILKSDSRRLVLKQGKYRLDILVDDGDGHSLFAPVNGKMTRTITERASCRARFRFRRGNDTIFDAVSGHASFEYVAAQPEI